MSASVSKQAARKSSGTQSARNSANNQAGDPHSELSSLSTSLDSLVDQLSEIAERCSSSGRDDLANELFEVERDLSAGARRLSRAVNSSE